ncbi:unnamed protein product [Anisakis simplex]|uniref:Serpentine receptor class gamma n=1 Tax=Anisakis simplex TaxID=6269 RepID=A0A0M3JXM7_ANISI|nr:unnamed protein product [Anisakis simplex]
MVIPASQHKLIKISRTNQRIFIKFACCSSILACISNLIGSSTNNWLYTAEVLKYYVFPNRTTNFDDFNINQPVYFKNASFGPWLFCWLDRIANFACIIVYMSAVSKEVGNKQYPATEMDDPLFHYSYGYSFIMLKASFLGTEIAALFSVLVYMAKRDERTYNRYHIRLIAFIVVTMNILVSNVSNGLPGSFFFVFP